MVAWWLAPVAFVVGVVAGMLSNRRYRRDRTLRFIAIFAAATIPLDQNRV